MNLTNDAIKNLALDLLHADHAADVKEILKSAGYWDDPKYWRLYGDKEGNFAQAGNQQSQPEAAIVEKTVNCVDTRLMLECLCREIDPESSDAPASVRDAVATFFEDRRSVGDEAGTLVNWSASQRTAESRNITLSATGDRPTRGKKTKRMCLTIADRGEGQSPQSIPHTILSLNAKNKQSIRFVQGKFNMGGSGALRFCTDGLQLIITRRNPAVRNDEDPTADRWAVTVVRREQPTEVAGTPVHSEFTYLAPVAAEECPRNGGVLGFHADVMPLMPVHDEPYAKEVDSGTAIKLYEYETRTGQSNILMKDGLLFALERLMPEVALPIRLHECRGYEGVKERSFETPLAGLVVRLEDGRGDNLEPGFPKTAKIQTSGMSMTAKIYAFKQDKASTYLRDEGVIFSVNGQAHGYLPKTIFGRPKAVGLPRLRDSLLIIVDCSSLSAWQREDLFMTSRDRLSQNPIRYEIERELERILKNHSDLKKLQQERRAESVKDQLSDQKPLEDVIGKVLKASPSLNSLFLRGERLSRPFAEGVHTGNGSSGDEPGPDRGEHEFSGRKHPSYFKIAGREYGQTYNRNCEEDRRCRIKFETDVENDYFDRATDRGSFELEVVDGDDVKIDQYSVTLEDGFANLSFALPDGAAEGDSFLVQTSVNDPTLTDPFVNLIRLSILKKQKHSPPKKKQPKKKRGQGTNQPGSTQAGIALPNVVEVKENSKNWIDLKFEPDTGCHVESEMVAAETGEQLEHTFYINMDNVALLNEIKYSSQDARLMEAKFKYANVMLGIAMLQDLEREDESKETEGESVRDRIRKVSTSIAPFIIPMIDQLSGLQEDDIELMEDDLS